MLQYDVESSIIELYFPCLNNIWVSPDLTQSLQDLNFSYIKCFLLRFEDFFHFFDSHNFVIGYIEALIDGAKCA